MAGFKKLRKIGEEEKRRGGGRQVGSRNQRGL